LHVQMYPITNTLSLLTLPKISWRWYIYFLNILYLECMLIYPKEYRIYPIYVLLWLLKCPRIGTCIWYIHVCMINLYVCVYIFTFMYVCI
jgi:hypothetical protein